MTELYSGLDGRYPMVFCDLDGQVIGSNGRQPMLVWKYGQGMQALGLAGPSAAPELAAPGSAAATGYYYRETWAFYDQAGVLIESGPSAVSECWSDRATLTFADADPTAEDSRITLRRVYRTTYEGTVYYLVAEVDAAETTWADNQAAGADEIIQNNEVLDPAPATPPHPTCLVAHRGRVFTGGGAVWTDGTITLTAGSTVVTGSETGWDRELVGWQLWVDGHGLAGTVVAVGSATALTLDQAYAGASASGATYRLAEIRYALHWSAAGQYHKWPSAGVLSVGRRNAITALTSWQDRVLIFTEHELYQLMYRLDPGDPTDAMLTELLRDAGACGGRVVTNVDGTLYVLDQLGPYRWAGGPPERIGALIAGTVDRINWRVRDTFHAVYDPARSLWLCFVALDDEELPYHALAYDTLAGEWQVFTFREAQTASCQCSGARGQLVVVLGGEFGTVARWGLGTMDLVRGGFTYAGTVTGTTATTLTDESADFDTEGNGLKNAWVRIPGTGGRDQWRRIVGNTATELTLAEEWEWTPAAGAAYQLGAIESRWRSGRLDLGSYLEGHHSWELWLRYDRRRGREVTVRVYYDQDEAAHVWDRTMTQDGVTTTAGSADIVVDLTAGKGVVRIPLGGAEFREVEIEIEDRNTNNPYALVGLALRASGQRRP